MLNNIVLQGRVVRNPELRYTQARVPVTTFTLAVERDVADQDGKRKADFIDCVAWRGTAELVSKYFRKGSAAIVSGRLELRDWTDKEGNKRRSAEVNVASVYFGESKKAAASADSNSGAAAGGGDAFSDGVDVDESNLLF